MSLISQEASQNTNTLSSAEKRARLAALMGKKADQPRHFPLSFAQQRLWFLNQLEPESSVYNIRAAIRITGDLNVEAVKQSLTEIVCRHETLRTTFREVDGKGVQVVSPPADVFLPVTDLRDYAEDEREEIARIRAAEESARCFDLSAGPLFRPVLFRLSERSHILLLTFHHIITDGWSLGVFIREFGEFYAAFVSGEKPTRPPLPIQYVDFAFWQRQKLKGERLDADLSYWKRQLADVPSLELPADKRRPSVQTFNGATLTFKIPEQVVQQFVEMRRTEGVTLFMILLAGFDALLARYTGAGDIVVGTPVANRGRSEIEGLIGFFVNTLVLRTAVRGAESFRELLQRVKQVCVGAYAHQDVPFERLVEELQPERDMSHTPLFQVMLDLQTSPLDQLQLADLVVERYEVGNATAKYDLMLSFVERDGELEGTAEYSTDLFEEESIVRLLEHYVRLLGEAAAAPEQAVRSLPLLSATEREQIVREWNASQLELGEAASLTELFEAEAKRRPTAVAVRAGAEELSYGELNGRANQLAAHLRRQGVGAEKLVGVCVERSVGMVTALLAVLKAGGAYVPLDPGYPAARLRYMVQDAGVELVIRGASVGSEVWEGVKEVKLEECWAEVAQYSTADVARGVSGENLAYVIYTSGSTGRPKGVMITHGSALALLAWVKDSFTAEELKLVVGSTSICFDLSVFEIFGPLSCGGAVQVVENALGLLELEREVPITLVNTVPSVMAELLRSGYRIPQSVVTVNLAGEALSAQLVEEVYEAGAVRSVNDLYGPTEDTTYTTWVRRSSDMQPTIGRPLPNTQIYILDEWQEPVPVGVSGEIYLGGAGLARGYWQRAEQTAERFVPDGLSGRAGARLYRTGDLGRYRSNGEIEYLGRKDHQVKLRGYRIELGEIESVLTSHSEIREAVVIVKTGPSGDGRLVAYVVGKENLISIDELRDWMKSKLPDYMVPGQMVALEQLPLTANGKVDRAALLALGKEEVATGAVVGPRTAMEEAVSSVWRELLGRERVGVEENFFELGGHSLLATRLLSRLRDVFGVELPLRTIFEQPTVGSLCRELTASLGVERSAAVPPLRRVMRTVGQPLSFAQQRLWFLDQLEPGTTAYNIPGALRLRGQLRVGDLERALSEIVRRHEALRTRFAVVEGQAVQVIEEAVPVRLVVEEVRGETAAEREAELSRAAASEAQHRFDLAAGGLLRLRLLRVDEEDYVLLLTMHHIISDGWSLGVLVRELGALYEAYGRGAEAGLKELAIQYVDYAVWQREWLQGAVLEEQLGYWREQLKGEDQVLELSSDRVRPAVRSYRGGSVRVEIDEQLVKQLKELSGREAVTLYMVLLASWQALLWRYMGAGEISVGTPVANRGRSEIEGLIGFFVNTLVLRTAVRGGESFRELLQRVKQVCVGAYAHQDVPFERLVEELQPKRDMSHTPLFQVMLNLLNFDESQIKLPGLLVKSLPTVETDIKSDLALYALEKTDGIELTLAYNTDLFEAATATYILKLYEAMLATVARHPGRKLNDLSLLSEFEWSKQSPALDQIVKHNKFIEFTKAEIEQSVAERFAKQVKAAPSSLAVKTERYEWTYAGLDAESNRIALALLQLIGAGEGRVGILLNNDAPVIAAVLGTLKANKTYVPLDPSHPAGRLKFQFEDAQVSAIVTNTEYLDQAQLFVGQTLINIDDLPAATDVELPEVSPDSLAYILYTSGSTGTPKGVMQSHRNLLHFIRVYTNNLKITRDDRLSLLPSFGFDAAVMDIYGALLNGASLYPLDLKTAGFGGIRQSIGDNGITIYHSTPTVFRSFASKLSARSLPSIRLVVLGGEEAHKSDADLFRETFAPGCTLINGLGPTESTVSLQYFLTHDDSLERATIPVGYPVAETEVLLVDEEGHDVETYGEIAFKSCYLALGYWRRPELTRAVFLTDPEDAGKRIYRTGDLGRKLHDGSIQYVGRKDSQVKIRGFRVELGEIEMLLGQHPAVQECVVTLKETTPSREKRLVAYFVEKPETRVSGDELRAFLADQLPAYMIPSAFVHLGSIPLRPNGKVDLKALPPVFDFSESGKFEYVAPRTEIEQALAEIWKDVLKAEKIGINDGFFELGGHSLQLLEVQFRLKEIFKSNIPLLDLFRYATINSLASHLAGLNTITMEPLLQEVQERANLRIEAKVQRRRALSKN